MGEPTVEQRSELAAPADVVWAHATSLDGINAELSPWMRMSAPDGITSLDQAEDVPVGAPWFTSVVWVLGGIPYDRMTLTLEVLEDRRFVECSSMLWMRSWRHERSVESLGDGACRLTDRLTPIPRVPGMGPVVRAVVRWLFAHRHRVLRQRFGVGEGLHPQAGM